MPSRGSCSTASFVLLLSTAGCTLQIVSILRTAGFNVYVSSHFRPYTLVNYRTSGRKVAKAGAFPGLAATSKPPQEGRVRAAGDRMTWPRTLAIAPPSGVPSPRHRARGGGRGV